MPQKAQIVIIGLGSAGLSALGEVKKLTDDFLLVQNGPYGTSCARSACMPTKTLMEVASLYHRRKNMAARGITGSEGLMIDRRAVLQYVRQLRDGFTNGMIESTQRYSAKIIQGQAVFIEPNVVKVGETLITGERIIIATGSRQIFPEAWKKFSDLILTTEDMVEVPDLPLRMAVIGLGPSGLEYAQALSRLGVEVTGFQSSAAVARISDPEVNKAVIEALQHDFPMVFGQQVEIERHDDGLLLRAGETATQVDKVLLTIGRQPNVDGLGLEKIGIRVNERGLPDFSSQTMQVADLPIFIAGDANGDHQILHEAIDEGHIAGYNAVHDMPPHCFKRRVPLAIIFTEPNIAFLGRTYRQLQGVDFVIGSYDFRNQSRARMSGTNRGMVRLYAERNGGLLLGAELAAPDGEHLAHLLALAIDQKMTVFDLLTLPFYHPVIEEGLRAAIKDAGAQVTCALKETDLLLCHSQPSDFLC